MPRPARLDHLRELTGLVNIRDKDMDIRPIDLSDPWAWAQEEVIEAIIRQYNAWQPVRIIVLKARQLGLSTISAATAFNWLHVFPGCQALTIAHDTETTQSLFEKVQDAWEWWPFQGLRHLRHASQRRLTIEETGSSIRIATAKNVKSGRGRTIQFLHASEMSFWDDPDTLMTGLTKTVPNRHGSCIIVECTANGIGNLYWRMWQSAVAGRSDYVPLFFPWWRHPEYIAERTLLRRVDLDEYERWLYEVLFENAPMQADQRQRARTVSMPHEERLARLEWRRWSIANEFEGDVQKFQQEMPATPEEAFLRTGRNRFPLDRLMECYEPMTGARGYLKVRYGSTYEFVRDPLGPITIFRWPSSDREYGDYMVAADPTRTPMGDPACIQVINRRTMEQVAVYHGHVDAVQLAPEIIRLGRYYNDALVSSEIEGPGYATIGALLALNYPRIWQHRWADRHPGKVAQNFGWSTNWNRKNLMIENLVHRIADRSIILHDQETYEQMRDYSVISDTGEMGPASREGHDDAVMSFAQAVICSTMETQPGDYTHRPAGTGPRGVPTPDHTDLLGVPPWEAWETEEVAAP